ncbi:hypothetical protein GALL_519900 [mine drainage metagenome]|uniref:Uncharacterized protein n=1 Tax=mine drainage metagenome TaxID=410659 RepID=A0A1J5PF40_9ZZZZ
MDRIAGCERKGHPGTDGRQQAQFDAHDLGDVFGQAQREGRQRRCGQHPPQLAGGAQQQAPGAGAKDDRNTANAGNRAGMDFLRTGNAIKREAAMHGFCCDKDEADNQSSHKRQEGCIK